MRAFAATDKFVTDVKQRKLKPCYLLAGDEAVIEPAMDGRRGQPEFASGPTHAHQFAG